MALFSAASPAERLRSAGSLAIRPTGNYLTRGTWGGSEHRNTVKKFNKHRITAKKFNETPSPQQVFFKCV